MGFAVKQLLHQKQPPVTVSPVELATSACRTMRTHRFSQLPVVSDKGTVIGLVTHESILAALGHFNVPLDRLRVSAAVTPPRKFFPDDDLLDLLDPLTDEYAVLIVDKDEHLLGVVTQDDLLAYFRKRAEDMLLIEEIELGLRDHVLAAFSDATGVVARDALCTAVDEIADQVSRLRRKFDKALGAYLVGTKGAVPVNDSEADKAFKAFAVKYRAKELDELTFEETRALLLHDDRWSTYGATFGLEKKALSDLLERVRDSRNKLAHFRGELDDEERERLRFCFQFLDNHRPVQQVEPIASIRESLQKGPAVPPIAVGPVPAGGSGAVADPVAATATATDIVSSPSLDDEQDLAESSYAPLVALLDLQKGDTFRISFESLEGILHRKLPSSARRHRAWWANDSVSHTQSRLWLEAGWRVATVNMLSGDVSFARIDGRQEAYIAFFNVLVREQGRSGSHDGSSWRAVDRIQHDGLSVPVLASFARGGRFRIELYIDLAVREPMRREANKILFDALAARQDEIETRLGHPLGWERLDQRRASRVALYTSGSILDDADALDRLAKWAAQMIPVFVTALTGPIHDGLRGVPR